MSVHQKRGSFYAIADQRRIYKKSRRMHMRYLFNLLWITLLGVLLLGACSQDENKQANNENDPPYIEGIIIANENGKLLIFSGVTFEEVQHVLNDSQEAISNIERDQALWAADREGHLIKDFEAGQQVAIWLDLETGGVDTSDPASTDSIRDIKVINSQ